MREYKFRAWWSSVKQMRFFEKGYIQCGHKDFDTGIIFPMSNQREGVYLTSCDVM